jgi:anaerobic selenocysteine-containing dehydrogenase
LHPSNGAAAGISDGQRVEIRGKNGEIVAIAKFDDRMRVGVVSVPHGFGGEANINLLTSTQAVDALTGMAHFSAFPGFPLV